MREEQITIEMRQCIDNCLASYASCIETTHHCLRLGGRHANPEHITLLNLCAASCRLTAETMLVDYEHCSRFCHLCAQMCDDCAAECESFGNDDTMEKCARICRKCAESCREMSKGQAVPA